MNVQFVSKEQVASSLFTFYFKPEKPLHYIAGQFIELYLPHDKTDSRGDKRWFTLSSAPHETLLAITTRKESRLSSFKHTLFNLSPGDSAQISAPLGDFVLPKNSTIPLLFIAGGIGSTPFRSIIIDSIHRAETRDMSLIHVLNAPEDQHFASEFSHLNDRYRVNNRAELSQNYTTLTSDHYVYVAGPEQMVEEVVEELQAHNIKRSQIYTDFFHGYEFDG